MLKKIKPSKHNDDNSQRKIQAHITSLIRKAKELVKSKLTNKENEINYEQWKSFCLQDKRKIKNFLDTLIEERQINK